LTPNVCQVSYRNLF